jgi:hypothetical protein
MKQIPLISSPLNPNVEVWFMKDVIWHWAHGPIPEGFKVSHKNGDPLDNTRDNLILVPEEEYPGDDDQVFKYENPYINN